MKLWLKILAVASLGSMTFACNKSETVSEPDAGASITVTVDPAGTCGNGIVERGEQCDSTMTALCNADCRWVEYCGNGTTEGMEVCDDGDRVSGDGCSADCRSLETCGNGIVDFARGEICDRPTGCEDCMSVPACGNGTVDTGEQCDDGNTMSLDGCAADCRNETVLVLSDFLPSLEATEGCDYTGDGRPDNQIGAGLSILNNLPMLMADAGPPSDAGITIPDITIGLAVSGLDDGSPPADDSSFRLSIVAGELTTGGALQIYDTLVNSMNMANYGFDARTVSGAIVSGQSDIEIPLLGDMPVSVTKATIEGTLGGTTAAPTISAGKMCAVIPLAQLDALVISDLLGSDLQFIAGILPVSCVDSIDPTLADLVAAGFALPGGTGGTLLGGDRPDIDVDGDGLEAFEITSGTDCQAVITGCFDGDGTRLERSQCFAAGSGINDGYSGLFTFTASETITVDSVIPTPDPTMMSDGGLAAPTDGGAAAPADGGTTPNDAGASEMDSGS